MSYRYDLCHISFYENQKGHGLYLCPELNGHWTSSLGGFAAKELSNEKFNKSNL